MAVTAHVMLLPDDAEPLPDLARFGAPAVQRAGPVTGDGAQDIDLELPPEEGQREPVPALRLAFDTAAADLSAQVASACDSIYGLAGTEGLVAFKAALSGTGYSPAWGSEAMPVRGRGDVLDLDEQRSPRRHRLLTEFARYGDTLVDRRGAAEAEIGKAATAVALERLAQSRVAVEREAGRYLSFGRTPATAAQVLDLPSALLRLTGPEAVALAGDLLAVAATREALGEALAVHEAEMARWDEAKRSVLEQDLERRQVRRGRPLPEREVFDLAEGVRRISDPPALGTAWQKVADERMALAQMVAALGRERPVLFRLWNTDAPALVRGALQRARPTNIDQQQAVVADLVPLRGAVHEALRSTLVAADTLIGRFADDPVAPFTFPALIDDTLTRLKVYESEFAHRAAQDRVRAELPGAELSVVSTWLGHVGLAAALSGAEFVAAAATLVELLVDLLILFKKAWRVHEQRLGVDAFLRPSDALAVDPTYSAVAMDAALLAVQVWLGRGDLKRLVRP